jgi:hypothetical protein
MKAKSWFVVRASLEESIPFLRWFIRLARSKKLHYAGPVPAVSSLLARYRLFQLQFKFSSNEDDV